METQQPKDEHAMAKHGPQLPTAAQRCEALAEEIKHAAVTWSPGTSDEPAISAGLWHAAEGLAALARQAYTYPGVSSGARIEALLARIADEVAPTTLPGRSPAPGCSSEDDYAVPSHNVDYGT